MGPGILANREPMALEPSSGFGAASHSLQPPSHSAAPPFEREEMPPLIPLVPVLWGDWPRCQLRRRWIRLLHTQTVDVTFRPLPSEENLSVSSDDVQTRAQRAHYRLSWRERMARNTRLATAPPLQSRFQT